MQRKPKFRYLEVALSAKTNTYVQSLARRTGVSAGRVLGLMVTMELDKVDHGKVSDELAHDIMPRPDAIDVSVAAPLYSVFGHRETELAAIFIINLCQRENRWCSFSQEELDAAYLPTSDGQNALKQQEAMDRYLPAGSAKRSFLFMSYDLEGTLFIQGPDGRYRVTEEFIMRCHRSSERIRRNRGSVA